MQAVDVVARLGRGQVQDRRATLALHEVQVGQDVHAAAAMAQAREHQPVGIAVLAPAAFDGHARRRRHREAAAPAELHMLRVIAHVERLAAGAVFDAVHTKGLQQRSVAVELGRFGRRRAQHQVPTPCDPGQQRLGGGCRQHRTVLQQYQRVGRLQRHGGQVRARPRVHRDAVGTQRLAQHVQRVVAGLALRRQVLGVGDPFVGAQVRNGQRHAQREHAQYHQQPAQARTHARHRNCCCNVLARVSNSASSGRRPA
ncbi:hypothetical protein D3C71_1541680 [compost metagenome]